MGNEITDFLKGVFAFSDLDDGTIAALCRKFPPEIADYRRGDAVLSPDMHPDRIGFVMRGKLRVGRERRDGTLLPLRVAGENESVGILTLFSPGGEYPTTVRAMQESRVLFFRGDDFRNILAAHPPVAMQVISFLTGRVRFLGEKVAALSSPGATAKLAQYLLNESRHRQTDTFPLNMQKTAGALLLGRASLYRALECLTDSGAVLRAPGTITIVNKNTLERISS